MTPAEPAPPSPAPPFYKSPFFIAFLVGAAVLTVLPFMQKKFLRAPPPIANLESWNLVDDQGRPFGSIDLKGRVWIAGFFSAHCDKVCVDHQRDLGTILRHVEDLDGQPGVAPIQLVSITVEPEADTPAALTAFRAGLTPPTAAWKFLGGPAGAVNALLLQRFLPNLEPHLEPHPAAASPPDAHALVSAAKFALVDQNGALRGFWDADDLGRGNLINAARLLAKAGPRP